MILADAQFTIGYYLGSAAFLITIAVIYWFVGRWGWIGLLIRIICAILFAFKLFQLLFTHPPIG